MGITQEELEARIDIKVEEALTELASARCSPSALHPAEPSQQLHATMVPLTKEDCLRLFRDDMPPPGPLLGIYRWAVDLGRTRYNFDFNFDTDNISLLDTYD